MSRPRVLTVGTGAVGAIYSWRLSQACHVTTVCRSNYNIVKQNGFDINSHKFGKSVFRPDCVVKTVSEAANQKPYDYLLITLKALPEIYNIADIISLAVKETTTIVLIQNGLGVEEAIAEKFPNNPLVSVVAYIATSQTSLGKITMLGGESLTVGRYLPSKVNSKHQCAEFASLLSKGNVSVKVVDDIERIRWQKLFWNAAFSPVCTLTGMNTSQVDASKEATEAVSLIMGEVIDAAIANGYTFDRESQMNGLLSKNVRNYKPSMQLDKERGNPMEVEVILGTPLRRAKSKGLEVPHLQLIYSLCCATNALIINKTKASL